MKKRELLVIYLTKDKKEILRDFNPMILPCVNEEVCFECVESNLNPYQKHITYRVTRIINILPDCVSVFLDI